MLDVKQINKQLKKLFRILQTQENMTDSTRTPTWIASVGHSVPALGPVGSKLD